MKLKIFLRFAVTIVILGLVVLGVWLIWFNPSNEAEIFNNLSTFVSEDYKKFNDKLIEIEDKDGLVFEGGSKKFIDGWSSEMLAVAPNAVPSFSEIATIRAYMFGEYNLGSAGTAQNYFMYDSIRKNGDPTDPQFVAEIQGLKSTLKIIDGAFDSYFSYSQLAEDVLSKEAKVMNNAIASARSACATFSASVDDYNEMEAKLVDMSSLNVISELRNIYVKIYNNFYNVLKTLTNLTAELKNFVNQKVFEGTEIYDVTTVYVDMSLKSMQHMVGTSHIIDMSKAGEFGPYTISADFLSSSYDCMMIYYKSKNWVSFSDLSMDVVRSYEYLAKNYKQAISGQNSVFNLSHAEKVELATYVPTTGETPELVSNYNMDYISYIQKLLKALYYFG